MKELRDDTVGLLYGVCVSIERTEERKEFPNSRKDFHSTLDNRVSRTHKEPYSD
jgi:hypothetical protein